MLAQQPDRVPRASNRDLETCQTDLRMSAKRTPASHLEHEEGDASGCELGLQFPEAPEHEPKVTGTSTHEGRDLGEFQGKQLGSWGFEARLDHAGRVMVI